MSNAMETYEVYKNKMELIADVKYASAVLQWDQETYLPPNGAKFRGRQLSTLSEISHRMFSDEELGKVLGELKSQELPLIQKRNIERTHEDYIKNKKYSSAFVRQLSEQINRTFHSWIEARRKNSFAVYEKTLDELIQLKRQEAEILGYENHPYNALLDEYEKGCTVELLDGTFRNILPTLLELLQRIAASKQVDDSFLRQQYPKQQQWEWGMGLIKDLQFDFTSGRQDISEHPFSTSFNSRDVRITTRIDENDFGNMTWSCIHETGHALYEQGLAEEQYGLPLGEACSYSIHESQSRLWENNVGRSLAFWKYQYPRLQQRFPQQLSRISSDDFYKGINKVQPSFIRTEADEITYHFHVYIRYELEKNLIDKTLQAADIPAFWNENYNKLLGVNVPDDKRGCLQDVHWSHGSFGYFPTYSLGSFYAAQFFTTASEQVKGLEDSISRGEYLPLLEWLRSKIHRHGRFFTSEELCMEVTGRTLDVTYFVNYLLHKYVSIYNL
jgi:carboxypeptidase Taq